MPPEPAAPLATIAAALRRERDRVGISLTELARRAGVAKSTLSQLESGTGNPSVETLWALGVALGVPFSRLVEPADDGIRVIRAGDGPRVRSEQADFTGTLLSAGAAHLRRDIYLIELEPGAVRAAEGHTPAASSTWWSPPAACGWAPRRARSTSAQATTRRSPATPRTPTRRWFPAPSPYSSWNTPDRARPVPPGPLHRRVGIVGTRFGYRPKCPKQ